MAHVRSNFWTGIYSLVNIFPKTKNINTSVSCKEADYNALRRDWKMVGNDIKKSIKKIKMTDDYDKYPFLHGKEIEKIVAKEASLIIANRQIESLDSLHYLSNKFSSNKNIPLYSFKANYKHTMQVADFLDYILTGLEDGTIEIVDKKENGIMIDVKDGRNR